MTSNDQQMMREEKLSKWGPGPWVDEPDHVEWRFEGVPCLMHRNGSGAWCGYVALEPGHPWHGLKYNDRIPMTPALRDQQVGGGERALNWVGLFCHAAGEDDGKIALDLAVNVHGGLTYSGPCSGNICHIPLPGDPACVCEALNASNRDRQSVHGGDNRRGGLGQPVRPHDAEDENRSPSDCAEARSASFKHRQSADRVASSNVGRRVDSAVVPPEEAAPQTGIRVAGVGRRGGGDPRIDSSVLEDQGGAGIAGNRIPTVDTAFAKTWRRGDEPEAGDARQDAGIERQEQAARCVGCGAVKDASNVHWIGFDCAHSGDLSPSLDKWSRDNGFGREAGTYRDQNYVRAEVEHLARQATAARVNSAG